jgi:3-oxoadipate enol-lactonase
MPTLALPEVEIHYEWHDRGADPAAPVLVFINGLLTDCSSWAGHLPSFSCYRCLVWDCRGQGRSSKPEQPSYPVATHAADLLGLLDALGLDEPVALIGLSNGGAAALEFAASRPERVAALIVSGAYAEVDRLLEAKLRSWIAAMQSGGPVLRFDVATPWVWGPSFLAQHWEALQGYRDKGLALDVAAAQRLIAGAIEHAVLDRLGAIRCPTLVHVGEHDLLTPPMLARAIVDAVPLARLELTAGLGHAAALEHVQGFVDCARRFLDAALATRMP